MSKLEPAQVLFSSLVLLLQLLYVGSIVKLLGSAVHPCKHSLCEAKDTQVNPSGKGSAALALWCCCATSDHEKAAATSQ